MRRARRQAGSFPARSKQRGEGWWPAPEPPGAVCLRTFQCCDSSIRAGTSAKCPLTSHKGSIVSPSGEFVRMSQPLVWSKFEEQKAKIQARDEPTHRNRSSSCTRPTAPHSENPPRAIPRPFGMPPRPRRPSSKACPTPIEGYT